MTRSIPHPGGNTAPAAALDADADADANANAEAEAISVRNAEPGDDTPVLVAKLAERLQRLRWQLATAESCTGGLIAGACTDLAGSSAWFDRGFVTYSNAAKSELLGVDAELIAMHGAVSEPTARAMAQGAALHSRARATIAVTGVAGPGGGSADKPVGTVWFGWSVDGRVHAERRCFEGDRAAVRAATVRHALATLLMHLPAG